MRLQGECLICGLSSPQLIRQGEGALLILTVPHCDSDEFLCEASNMVGSQRSRPVPLPASLTPGEEPEARFLYIENEMFPLKASGLFNLSQAAAFLHLLRTRSVAFCSCSTS